MSITHRATQAQIANLSQRGFQHYVLKPPICPCPMHDDTPEEAVITTGEVVLRNKGINGISWHHGCSESNMRHALTGIDTFGDDEPRERTSLVLAGPHEMGRYSLPPGLGSETVCSISGVRLLNLSPSDAESAKDTNDDLLLSRLHVDLFDLLDDESDTGFALPAQGSSFFAAIKYGEVIFLQDSSHSAAQAIAKHSPGASAGTSLWSSAGTDAEGRTVLHLDWKPLGVPLTLLEPGMETAKPLEFRRRFSAWSLLCRGWPVENTIASVWMYEEESESEKRLVEEAGQVSTEQSVAASAQPVIDAFHAWVLSRT